MFSFNQKQRDEWVARQASLIPAGSQVLDVGAGMGRYRDLFSHCVYKAHDFAEEPTTIGKYTRLDYVSDICNIPVSDSTFDVILCTEVLEHVPEPSRALQEMARILRPGGTLLLTAPLGCFLHQEPYHYYGGFTPHWYEKVMPEAGFKIERIVANRGFFSWFGQEAQRFSGLLDPRRTLHTGARFPFIFGIWILTVPVCRLLFPAIGTWLDTLALEKAATVGYFVVAKRQERTPTDHVETSKCGIRR